HPRKFSSRKNGLQMMIDSLRKEIEEYDALKQQLAPIKITSIQELPLALIRARIAMGMTQKELAEKMGVKEQQVQRDEANQFQRDEANQYSWAGFQPIAAVAEALNLKIQETLILLES
nr:helix-turn-helix transcriptional regulator [Xenococcaceae cyanobacterium MO_167.B52]